MTGFLDGLEDNIPALRRYARALTGNSADADDLVQDCLERALRKQALWRPSAGALRPWLFKLLLNLFRNQWAQNRKAHFAPLEAIGEGPVQEPGQPQKLALNEVERALVQLADHEREALLLVVLEGFSYAEAAKILDIPQGTLMSRLSRARANLKRLTSEHGAPRLRAVK